MIRRRRKSFWSVEESSNGIIRVSRGNRTIATGMRSHAHAMSLVERGWQPGEKVWVVEPDGYRTDVTKSMKPAPSNDRPRK